jgi:hypothetical protein
MQTVEAFWNAKNYAVIEDDNMVVSTSLNTAVLLPSDFQKLLLYPT